MTGRTHNAQIARAKISELVERIGVERRVDVAADLLRSVDAQLTFVASRAFVAIEAHYADVDAR